MNGNSIGKALVLTCFGESHGECVGAVIDGCPAGLPMCEEEIQSVLEKRRPGFADVSTPRKEADVVQILSGVHNGFTTGAPICMMVRNKDVDSTPYELIRDKPRPGHADYAAYVRYGGFNDLRGGGRFSGRTTVAHVMAGGIAKKLLGTIDVEVLAHTIQIGKVKLSKEVSLDDIRRHVYENTVRCADPEAASAMRKEILQASIAGDSVGGIVEALALNVPAGLGDPIFDSLDSDIARMLFNIPAVKGVEVGAGFRSASMRGSENNDPYILREGKVVTLTNNAGGILGGISTGMPIVVRVAFKPTSSIPKKQKTVNLSRMEETEIEFVGRHDRCIVPRAVPVVESSLAFVLADHAMRVGKIPVVLK